MLVDQLAFRLTTTLIKRPEQAELERISREVDAAIALFGEQGWIASPATYHRTPDVPSSVRSTPRRSGNVRYQSLTWLDGYEPHPGEPGSERFADYPKNHVARAMLLEHRTRERPWLLCVHGFGMGSPGLDLRAFRALRFHRDLDLNVAFLTLPFHGRRSPTAKTRPMMPSADVMDTLHGLTQAVWDARQLLALLRARSDQPISMMGISLGGLVCSLVASLDEPDGVVTVVPAVDIPALLLDGLTRSYGEDPQASELLERSRPVYAPVSPLHLEPRVPRDRRFVVAGTLDQFVRPSEQVVDLWRHWDEPAMHWYHGGHTSVFWNGGVQRWIETSLSDADLI